MKNKTHEDFKEQAYTYCELYGLDPEARVQYPDPNGYAVCRWRSQWIGIAKAIHEHWVLTQLVNQHEGK